MKNLKKHKHFHKFVSFGIVLATCVFFLTFFSFFDDARSSALDNVSGYAWGADNWADTDSDGVRDADEIMIPPGGMGWLSFNCTTGGNCGAVDYGVNVDTVTGNITGYAWSSNYGWLKFGGFAGQIVDPGGLNITVVDARVNFNTGAVTGWARFCSPTAIPASCEGTHFPTLDNGGWDGWVSLSGTSPTYGVILDTSTNPDTFSGYAWGGDDAGKNVVGWINFSDVLYTPVTTAVTLQANPTAVGSGGTTTLSWLGVGIPTGPTSCTGSHTGPGGASWDGPHPFPMSSPFTTSPLPPGNYTFTIQCGTAVSSVDVTSGIQLYFYAEPTIAYPPPYETILYWNSIPAGSPLSGCTASSSASDTNWNGPVSNPPPAPPSIPYSALVNVPLPTVSYTLTCQDSSNNTITETIYVNQGVPTESVQISNSPVVENPPSSGSYTTTMTWATVNITPNSCVPSSSPAIPSWNTPNPKADNGSQANVSVPASAPAFTLYSLTCTGLYSGNPITVSLSLNQNSGNTSAKKAPIWVEDKN